MNDDDTPRVRRGFRCLLTALIVMLLIACLKPVLAQQSPSARPSLAGGQSTPPKQQVAVVPVAEDADIADRLQRILLSTGWFEAAQVSARDGVVFLDGRTTTQEHQQWAGALAENTQGTVAVVNRIEVEAGVQSTFARAGEELTELYRQLIRGWPSLVLVIVIVVVTSVIARVLTVFTRRFFSKRIASSLLRNFVVRVLSMPVFILGIYLVLQVFGLTRLALTLLGGTGLVGIIVGFAFRDIAENFLASLLLSIRNPFRKGDLIEVAGHTGIVKNLNVRSTVLLTLDGDHVQIPNATIFKSTIKNHSSTPSRRADFLVGISYDSPTAKAQILIDEILREHPAVLDTPEPLVLVENLGAATVDLRAYYWFDSAIYSPLKINSALLRLTKSTLLKNGIELPDSAREVIFPKGVPLLDVKKGRESVGESNAAKKTERAGPPSSEERDTSTVNRSEGNLSSDSRNVRTGGEGVIPEAKENLLAETGAS